MYFVWVIWYWILWWLYTHFHSLCFPPQPSAYDGESWAWILLFCELAYFLQIVTYIRSSVRPERVTTVRIADLPRPTIDVSFKAFRRWAIMSPIIAHELTNEPWRRRYHLLLIELAQQLSSLSSLITPLGLPHVRLPANLSCLFIAFVY